MPEGYEPLSGRAAWAQRALVASVIIDTIAVVSGYFEYRLYNQDVVTEDEAEASDIRVALVVLLQLSIFVWAIVAFIRWFKRAYANIEPLGAKRRFRVGWTIWGWFVPILNLWRPKQVANDIWRASDPDEEARVGAYEQKPVPAVFAWWWGAWVVSGLVYNAAMRVSFRAETFEELSDAAATSMAADGLAVVAGVLAILVVRQATERQEKRAARLAAIPPAETSPRNG